MYRCVCVSLWILMESWVRVYYVVLSMLTQVELTLQ